MSKKASNPMPPNCERPAPPPAPPRKPRVFAWPDISTLSALCTEREIVKASPCTCTGFVLQYEGECQCGKKKRIDELTSQIESLLCSPSNPPRKANPAIWPFGGYPGGLNYSSALHELEAGILTQAANIIETNAEALRESSTVPGTENWPDERDLNLYLRDIDIVLQLRKLIKELKSK